jgi:hypothetical protein
MELINAVPHPFWWGALYGLTVGFAAGATWQMTRCLRHRRG